MSPRRGGDADDGTDIDDLLERGDGVDVDGLLEPVPVDIDELLESDPLDIDDLLERDDGVDVDDLLPPGDLEDDGGEVDRGDD